jgi:isoprene synthase
MLTIFNIIHIRIVQLQLVSKVQIGSRIHPCFNHVDIFKSFLDQHGHFKASLGNDVKGMLSLYEASFLSYEGEQILDDANAFTTFHLNSLHEHTSDEILLEQVNHALLELPLHHRIQRLEARWYIESYSRRKDANQVLLEAATLDFNIVQSTLQKDIQELSG